MTKTLLEQYKAARRAGAPLVAIETPDSDATIERLKDDATPTLRWDFPVGFRPLNKLGESMLGQVLSANADPDLAGISGGDPTVRKPDAAVLLVERMRPNSDRGAVVFISMGHQFLPDIAFIAALRLVRDQLKTDGRTIVLMGESMRMPIELRGHVVVIEEPLPDDAELMSIAREIYEGTDGLDVKLTDEQLAKTAETLRGTFAFAAETLAAMALTPEGFDGETLTSHARRQIEETVGLSVDKGGETFADIGGLEQAKRLGKLQFSGKRPPRLVVRIEEIEKATAGAKGDLSGTSTDSLQVLLSEMEDNGWSGMLAYGAPGAGKSLYAKSLANTFAVLPMRLDVNACKGSLVGQSEANIRAAMRVVKAIGGSDVFFVASMNRMDIPPELRRRFRAGVWYFDTPDKDERAAIWKVQLAKHELNGDEWKCVDEDDMTGADIRNLCEIASRFRISLKEAMEFVVLLKHSAPESIHEARAQADGRYNSASYAGRYRMQGRPASSGEGAKPKRRMQLKKGG